MPAYWWPVAVLVLAALAATGRWMARWTGRHPPIVPGTARDATERK